MAVIIIYAEHTNQAGKLVPKWYPGCDESIGTFNNCDDYLILCDSVDDLKKYADAEIKRGEKENSLFHIRVGKSIHDYLEAYYG